MDLWVIGEAAIRFVSDIASATVAGASGAVAAELALQALKKSFKFFQVK